MRISVVTVAFNSADTIEDTIRSVLAQQYPPCEYIVKDGGSQDGTLEIIEKHRPEFETAGIALRVISGKDQGIYDAMNQGIQMATGDIVGLINADDWYEPEALAVVNATYEENPFDVFYADLRMHKPGGATFIKHSRVRNYATSRDWNHPTTFITKEMYGRYQYHTDTIHDDYDLILRMKKDHVRMVAVPKVLANFRMNGVSHTRNLKKALERGAIKYRIYRQNGYSPFYAVECYGVELAKLIIG